jgi:hypothetical protein
VAGGNGWWLEVGRNTPPHIAAQMLAQNNNFVGVKRMARRLTSSILATKRQNWTRNAFRESSMEKVGLSFILKLVLCEKVIHPICGVDSETCAVRVVVKDS